MDFQDVRQRYLACLFSVAVLMVVGWQLMKWWTRPPAIEFDNLRYIQLMTTAVSCRSAEMLTKVEAAIGQRFNARQMSEREHQHFQRLIALAREGEWEQADRQCYQFAEAQLNRSRTRAPSKEPIHDARGTEPHEHAADF